MGQQSRAATAVDERIYRERRSKFYGTARVSLSLLHFPPEPSLLSLPRPKKDVRRLKRVVRKEDCYRLADDEHHVSARISQLQLDAALLRAGKSLQDLNSKDIPPIIEPSSPLQCLHGKGRLQAVGDLLDDGDDWWAVDLYAEDASPELQTYIREGFSNSINFCDGEIMRYIFFYHDRGDDLNERKWRARLTRDKEKDLNTMLAVPEFRKALHKLVIITGLWPPFHLGTFRRYVQTKCYEQLTNYLKCIYDIFCYIADGDADVMRGIDLTTVEGLECRAPSASSEDAAAIQRGMRGAFFPHVTDRLRRERIEQNIMRIPQLIPSLTSFCEDTKYLEAVSLSMRLLVELREKETVQRAFARIYKRPEQYKNSPFPIQDHEETFIEGHAPEDAWFGQAFLQIVLKSMRDFPQMVNISCRKDENQDKPAIMEPNAITIHQLASLAHFLGFSSGRIDRILSKNPMLQELRLGLARLEPNEELVNPAYRDSEAAELLRVWEERRSHRGSTEASAPASPPLTTDDVDQELSQRSGRPFDKAHKHDKKYMFFRRMIHGKVQPRRYITSLFVKRSVFALFFMDAALPEPPEPAADEMEVTTHTPTVVQDQPLHPAPGVAREEARLPNANPLPVSEPEHPLQRLLPPPPGDQISGEGVVSLLHNQSEDITMSDDKAFFRNRNDSSDVKEVDFNEHAVHTAAKVLTSEQSTLYFESRPGHYEIIMNKYCYKALSTNSSRTIWFERPVKPDRAQLEGGKYQKLNNSGSGQKAKVRGAKKGNQIRERPAVAGQGSRDLMRESREESDSGIL